MDAVYVLHDMRKGLSVRDLAGVYKDLAAAKDIAEVRFPEATRKYLEWRYYETIGCWTLNFAGHGLLIIHRLDIEG